MREFCAIDCTRHAVNSAKAAWDEAQSRRNLRPFLCGFAGHEWSVSRRANVCCLTPCKYAQRQSTANVDQSSGRSLDCFELSKSN
jgi:hypothetical protein